MDKKFDAREDHRETFEVLEAAPWEKVTLHAAKEWE